MIWSEKIVRKLSFVLIIQWNPWQGIKNSHRERHKFASEQSVKIFSPINAIAIYTNDNRSHSNRVEASNDENALFIDNDFRWRKH